MSALIFAGPVPRDELAAWTTAALAPRAAAAPVALSALPWPGRSVVPGGRADQEQAVFVRTTPSTRPTTDEAFYIHGLAGGSTNWTSMAGLLADLATGHAPDLPGSGRSDPPRNADYSIGEQVRVLARVIAEVARGPVHLVGNSLGGFLSTVLAATHPELVKTLTLVSPAVPDLRLTRDRGADVRLAGLLEPRLAAMAETRLSAVPARQRVDGMVDVCFGQPGLVIDEDRRAAAAEIEWRKDMIWTQRAIIQQLRGLMAAHLAQGGRGFWAAARRIRVPTLVVWGTRDRMVDVRLAQRTAEAFADGRLLVLPGVGHVPQMEAPLEVAQAVAALWADVTEQSPSSLLPSRHPGDSGAARPRRFAAMATFFR